MKKVGWSGRHTHQRSATRMTPLAAIIGTQESAFPAERVRGLPPSEVW